MAIGQLLTRVTFTARLGGSEIALFGFHMDDADATGYSVGILQAIADKARDTWIDTWGANKTFFGNGVVFESVRVDRLNPAAGLPHLKVENSAFAPFATSGATSYAGTGGNSGPWSSSVVISMAAYSPGEFEVNKGRYRGRYYLPPMIATNAAGPTGEMPEGNVDALAAAAQEFHNQLNGDISEALDDDIRLVVLSRSDDTARRVEQIWVDSKLDTQRRRENRQPATYKKTLLLDQP